MEETRWKEKIKPLDENAMEEARAHWMTVGKHCLAWEVWRMR